MSQSQDYVRDLNNYLQGHPTGNLTGYLSWNTWVEGPPNQATNRAVAKFDGQPIGSGFGLSKGLAKAQAAVQALEYLNQHYPY